MLGGIDPIFLFQFFKLSPSQQASLNAKIPIVGSLVSMVSLIPIPLYLSETITGVLVDTESKNIDIETDIEGKKDGTDPVITQRPMNSAVTINMVAKKDSLGLIILSAMMDLILPKLTSREYSISFFHGSVAIFGAQLHSFAVDQDANTDLARISMQLTTATKVVPSPIPVVGKVVAPVPAL